MEGREEGKGRKRRGREGREGTGPIYGS